MIGPSSQSELWFIAPRREAYRGGLATVDYRIRAAVLQLTRLPVRWVTVKELADLSDRYKAAVSEGSRRTITLISHFDAFWYNKDADVIWANRSIAKRHVTFIHQDPTTSKDLTRGDAANYRDAINRAVDREWFDIVACIGPRMHSHLLAQWPQLGSNILELGAGMTSIPESVTLPASGDSRQPAVTKLRVLFGSPTTPENAFRRGLDIFARAAGLVQRHFRDRRVDFTFVVSGVMIEHASHANDILEKFDAELTTLASEMFDGPTEFEIRENQTNLFEFFQTELGRADIFVLPSRDEPFGIVAAEALSRGIPVVVSQNSGIGESLLQLAAESFLPTGKYICVLTPESLAQSIIAAVEDARSSDLFRRIAEGAYPRLSWTNATHAILESADVPLHYFRPVVDRSEVGRRRAREIKFIDALHEIAEPGLAERQIVLFSTFVPEREVQEEYDSNEGRVVTRELVDQIRVIRKRITDEAPIKSGGRVGEVIAQWEFIDERLRRVRAAGNAAAETTDREIKTPPAVGSNSGVELAALGEGHVSLYPEIVDPLPAKRTGREAEYTMMYAGRGSIDRLESAHDTEVFTSAALSILIGRSLELKCPQVNIDAWQFCRQELETRVARVNASAERLSDRQSACLDLDALVEECVGMFEQLRPRTSVEAPLRYAVHGDFGLNNVVVLSSKKPIHPLSQIRFIDTRANWMDAGEGRIPVWDVAMDLASLYVFGELVHPALSEKFNFRTASRRRPPSAESNVSNSSGDRASRPLSALIETVVIRLNYEAEDPTWKARTEASGIVRLLGSVGTQLSSARTNSFDRAVLVRDLLTDYLRSPGPLINWDSSS